MNVIQRFTQFYQELNQDSAQQLEQIYSQQVTFIDPASKHQGLKGLRQYFSNLLENTEQCTFDIHTVISDGEQHGVTWQMTIIHSRLNGGKPVAVDGMSHLRTLDDLIIYHRDYFDLGQMLYEQIPVLKHLILGIKGRLSE